MPLGTWWRGDILPELAPLPALSVRTSTDISLISRLNGLSPQEARTRLTRGHHFYIALMNDTPVAYGWVGTREGGIRELQFSFPIKAQDRYLWDFQTFPEWRGRGIYPHFLQEIIRQELPTTERFWIGYEPGNEASQKGISKAGFQIIGDLAFDENNSLSIILFEDSERAHAGAEFFGLPVIA